MALEYQIQATFPVPIGGLNFSMPENLLDHIYSRDMSNMLISDGTMKPRTGYTQLAASYPNASNPIMEGVEFGDASGNLHVVFIDKQKLIEFTSPSTWTSRAGALSLTGDATNVIFACTVGGLSTENLYITNGIDKIKVWTGSGNWTDLATTGFTTLKAKTVIGFKGHLLLGDMTEDSNRFPYRIRWSTIGAPTTWNTVSAGFLNLIEDETNSKVMCFHPYANNLICYKFGSIYQLTYQGDPNYFVPRMVVADRGTISRKGVAPFGDAHLVVSNDNIHVFDGTGFVFPPPGDRIKKDFFDNLNWAFRGMIYTKAFPSRFEVWILYPRGSSITCNAAYCWNYKENTWTHHTFNDTIYSLMNFNEAFDQMQPMAGMNGNVFKLFTGNTDNGTAINAYFRSKLHAYTDFNTKTSRVDNTNKTVQKVEVDCSGTNPTIQIGATNNLMGTIDYDAADQIVTGATGVKEIDKRKSGRWITAKFANVNGESFEVAQYTLYIESRGSRI